MSSYRKITDNGYPPISDYAFISDCHSAALVSLSASIDWCCMPRIDSSSCFGRLLDWKKGGFFQICPSDDYEARRSYLGDSLILETTFRNKSGKAKISDCFTMREGGKHHPHRQILRILEGLEGKINFTIILEPRFDYGAVKPWIRRQSEYQITAIGGSDGLLICSNATLNLYERHSCRGSFAVKKGDKLYFSITHRPPDELDETIEDVPGVEELNKRFDETVGWWKQWISQSNYNGCHAEQVRRSAIVLKGLSNAPTGAIAAAPSISLPESPGGGRNWDYRASWIRDSVFSLRSLMELGFNREADGFRRFIERSAAGSADDLQILYGLGGERHLIERELDHLEGYRGAKPVRVGNAAINQQQFDVYGELLDLAWSWHKLGNSPDDDYCEFITELVELAVNQWRNPDCGIWEIRGEPRHFVLSKAMCWVAVDRAIKLANDMGIQFPDKRWRRAREDIREWIETQGVDHGRNVFIQAAGYPIMDASLLLLPVFGYIPFDDQRMLNTTHAICEELKKDGLICRYPDKSDNLEGSEGVFIACTFWLVECLVAQGKTEEAVRYFEKAEATANDIGLFSEEYDVSTGDMLGNFPQGLTHLSHIAAAVVLDRAGS